MAGAGEGKKHGERTHEVTYNGIKWQPPPSNCMRITLSRGSLTLSMSSRGDRTFQLKLPRSSAPSFLLLWGEARGGSGLLSSVPAV